MPFSDLSLSGLNTMIIPPLLASASCDCKHKLTFLKCLLRGLLGLTSQAKSIAHEHAEARVSAIAVTTGSLLDLPLWVIRRRVVCLGGGI